MDILLLLYGRIPSLLEGFWTVLFLNTQMQIKRNKKWVVWICTPILWMITADTLYWWKVNNIILRTIILLTLTFLWECLFYSGLVLKKMFAALISNPLLNVFDVLGIAVFQSSFHVSKQKIESSTAAAVLVKAVAIAVVLLFGFFQKRGHYTQLKKKEWSLLILFVGLILFVMINIARVDVDRPKFSQANVLNELALLALLYLVFYIIKNISERHVLEQEKAMLQQQVEEEQRSLQALTETHQAIRSLSHDFRDHLVCVQGYLQQHKEEAALQYLQSISLKTEHTILPVNTNNIAIDAILNDKYLVGVRSNIHFQYAVEDLSNMPFSDIDAVTILSNALNNAIEACTKVQGQRWIYVQMITRNEQFLISVKNPVERPVKITDNQIATTKSDKLWHGIGLTNVQAVTRQNHGHMFLTCKDKIFHFLAVFNLE